MWLVSYTVNDLPPYKTSSSQEDYYVACSHMTIRSRYISRRFRRTCCGFILLSLAWMKMVQ